MAHKCQSGPIDSNYGSLELIELHGSQKFQMNPSKTVSAPFKNKNIISIFRPNFFLHFGTFHFPRSKSAQSGLIITPKSFPQSQYGFKCAQTISELSLKFRFSNSEFRAQIFDVIFLSFFDEFFATSDT